MFPLMLWAAVLLAGAETPSPPEAKPVVQIVASTTPPAITRHFTLGRLYTRDAYPTLSGADQHRLPTIEWPPGKGSDLFGVVSTDSRTQAYVVQEVDGQYQLLIDCDQDKDLSEESPHQLQREGETYAISFDHRSQCGPLRLEFRIKDGKLSNRPFHYVETQRRGTARIDERTIDFMLIGWDGRYDHERSPIFFDLNNDHQFDFENQQTDERFEIPDRHVTLYGRTYAFHVAPAGNGLTLTPVDVAPSERAALTVGSPAPDFVFLDLTGKQHRLSEYRGKTVMLYAWATWCAPCQWDAEHIASAMQQFGPDTFHVVGLNKGESADAILEYVRQKNVRWQQTLDPEGSILSLYRISAIPAIILVSADGRIVDTTVRGPKLAQRLGELIGNRQEVAK